MRALLKADGTTVAMDTPKTMAECHKLIGADVLDTVNLRHMGHPLHVMLVDDQGHSKRLPVNVEATRLYHKNCRPNTTHTIRGDVVVVPDDDFS